MLNQGIQTGARIVLPIVGRAAGTIARKTLPAAEEIGYRIGKSKVGEKIIAQGPFVMNNEGEIMEAYRDFQMGKMGILIED